ncbi:DUF4123 domain-containing protein [Chromatium okenii]|jgi:hypothetical protein|uniref:DUF4123 domain-containing protein n=1 Tax=Chromatium okenii TaxID=61644 RepID=A0A2S7XN32_9GAMM|nr:DUF4123 domain-containing protein [Chromatium okenii]PQJ95157.1 hypothetical protein CXB77_12770 [Chromatium okenii]
MSDDTQQQVFQRRLGNPKQALCAVLDGASLANLPTLLSVYGLPNVCLLPGDLDEELARVAPYLVQFQADSEFLTLLLAEGLGNHWGILAASNAHLRTLRIHFRNLLSVWDFEGNPHYFRYYDPRVLRVYLPTCNAEELDILFNPISAYYIEGEVPASLQCFMRGEQGLIQSKLLLA